MLSWLKSSLPFLFGKLKKVNHSFSPPKEYLFKCGHTSSLEADVVVFGETRKSRLSKDDLDLCPQCLGKIAIPCGNCGKSIMPYEYVGCTTQKKTDGSERMKVEGAQLRNGCVIICHNCCEMWVDAIGKWKPPGIVDTEDLPFDISPV